MIMPEDRSRAVERSPRTATTARGRNLMLATVAAAAASLVMAGGGLAQRSEPRITVASTVTAEAASQVALQIQVGPRDALPQNSFVRLRGLPHSVSLSEGHAIAPGSWAVPLLSLPALRAIIPAGASGRSELTVSLVSLDGTVLTEARTALVIGPSAADSAGKQATNIVVVPKPLPIGRSERGGLRPELSGEERERAEKLIAQGDRFLSQGNIAIARQFFQRAADAGFAPGAMRLAATFDPGELTRLQAQGVVPDRAEAKRWYERARELGAPEADERLARLGGS
jgi:TPR repeat protein